jgi:cation diffusion facilitator CzcD-associated flavoprotein CzcO
VDDAPSSRVDVDTERPHFDVVVVGAGISGIDAAWHLRHHEPDMSFVVVDALASFGGTWLTHKYPGIRSDSDLYTFGFDFKPWIGTPIATADEIQRYLGEVIDDNDLARHIRYHHRIETAEWSSAQQRWTLNGVRTDSGDAVSMTGTFLWMCQGYYRHAEGYTPDWPGMTSFRGRIIHPQTWPDDADLSDKDVVVIGSGATAATLVPAIADDCRHVTVVQRSPTYFWPGPNRNEVADMLRELDIPAEWTHEIVRRKVLHDQELMTRMCFEQPEFARGALIDSIKPYLPEDFDVGTHFTPRYLPWRQRIARVPDGDLFVGIAKGQVSMVTEEIETFTSTGLRTKSGLEISADVVITATGFNLCVLGDIQFSVDGSLVDFADTITYRGLMFTGVPNMAWVFGYFRASWTLRADLVSDFLVRLFDEMRKVGATSVIPQLRPEDLDDPVRPWVNEEDFNPGYLMRSMALMPKRLDKPEWCHSQDYWREREAIPLANLRDGCLIFGTSSGELSMSGRESVA